jgi:hypothetical protein
MIVFRTTLFAAICAALMVSLASIGCGDDSSPMGDQSNGTAPVIAAVTPADAAINVFRSANVGIGFIVPMDTNSVMDAFHLCGGSEMHQWMDSLGHHRRMGGMGMMNMGHMMEWMDSIDYDGRWHWNERRDSCWFDPDSTLMSDADHMIYLYGPVRSHDGMAMVTDRMMYGGPMYHFRTMP